MKYIIDIPEEYYKVITDIPNRQCTVDMLIIKNGTPLEDIKEQYDKGYKDGVKETFIEELEKIKAEIETKCKVCCLPRIIAECNISKSNREWCEYYYCLKIINEHIAELKGENK